MINPGSYEKFGDGLSDAARNSVYRILGAVTQLNRNIAKDPDNIMRYKRIYDKEIAKIAKDFDNDWKNWIDRDIAKAYLSGLKYSEIEMKRLGLDRDIDKKIINGSFLIDNPPPPIPEIPGQTLLLFDQYKDHVKFFGVFRNAAYYSLEEQRFQIIRKANDIYRESAILAAEKTFKEADIFTRLKYSQEMLNDLAKKGIQTITYKNGAKYSLDTYCEMAGRALTGRAALQASLNRFLQSGYTLVVVSSHFRACDLCTPYEGKTLSIERHPVYESVDDAETQGLFHSNCYCKDTEVYTNNGWKLFKDVKTEDKIFSLNPNNHIPEWCNFTKRFEYDPGNEMIEFKSNSFDLLVTKNHKMYIKNIFMNHCFFEDAYNLYNYFNFDENNYAMLDYDFNSNVVFRGESIKKPKIINNYDGLVYCLELEKNHIMLVRRNGKISWCGNCKHDVSVTWEGKKAEPPRLDHAEQKLVDEYGYQDAQKIAYSAQLRQRQIERNIRSYKRRSEVSLTKDDKRKADLKVKYWQSKQREHLKENTFLNRKYSREQIGKAH